MNASALISRVLAPIVDTIRTLQSRRATVAITGLICAFVLALSYVSAGALGYNPARSTITLHVQLPESGGLLAGQDVTLRGIHIGTVEDIGVTEDGLRADIAIDPSVGIPKDAEFRVSGLSPAGEQYLDIRPTGKNGPFLRNGDTVAMNQTATPVQFHKLVMDAEGLLAQLDPAELAAMTKEIGVGKEGPKKLANILDGGVFLISTLDSVLPETIRLIGNSRTVLAMISDAGAKLRETGSNTRDVVAGASRMEGGYRTLVGSGSRPLSALDSVIADNSDTMVQLLGNLTTVAQLSYVRVPALKALFPPVEQRGSVIDAVGSIFHDGYVWEIVDPYPRYSCDYNLPRHPPSQADFPEPYRYTYCANPDPAVLVRGARNAPRPPGDDTASPPPEYDRLAVTDPTPVGPNTIPTPYGGPRRTWRHPPNRNQENPCPSD
ncbi:MlaD family protein [Mycobacteroides abscessus]|uniref:MlaD family protein n=1 Tax=Mycobacteroides abscessus TaxID=36809 RepID=UPI0009F69E31|nr:MlaD family protein [Mycobacteroides abscessus]ORA30865.1 mammalian cell entry protein [Mycobacteroides abscessus subsp. bolletii]